MNTLAKTLAKAVQRHRDGRLDEAETLYREVLAADPRHADALHLLGVAAHQRGMHDQAVQWIEQAVAVRSDTFAFHHNLAEACRALGRLPEAAAAYRRALELNPRLGETHNSLGNVLVRLGRLREAVECYRRAVDVQPNLAEAHNNLASALYELGQPADAVEAYRRALALTPDAAETHYNLGNALADVGRRDEAIAAYRRALALRPEYPAALGNLVHELQHVCAWEGLEELSARLRDALSRPGDPPPDTPVSPFGYLTLPTPTTAAEQLRAAEQWVARRLPAAQRPLFDPARRTRPTWVDDDASAVRNTDKLVVGYLSADFHAHATAWLVAELFEQHDRARFEIAAYSYGPDDGSPIRRRIAAACDRFVELRDASHEEAARQIAADGVDILVDLKGHTKHARSPILALRPAPIQVNYLGYPGTMGAALVDYILVDDFIVPPDQQPYFSERLVHLSGCYQVNDSRREIAPNVPTRAECGLPERGFVFASFNNNYKITPAMFSAWMGLLRELPESVLWLLESNPFAPGNLRREAALRGVEPERLVFAPKMPLAEHLARHRAADLFLDSFPVNAHTTASDALWAGLPVLTLAGETFIARVAGSLLRALDLPELITTSLEEYAATALRLARNPAELASLGERLAAAKATSPLFRAAPLARQLERAYAAMWRRHAAGLPSAAFRVEEE